MLRKSLLFLSEREGLKDRLLSVPAARRTAERFVAGEDLSAAIEVARRLEADGFRVTLDYLGESVHDESEARRVAESYERCFAPIADAGSGATISLKLTQLGLDTSFDLCVDNLSGILAAAADRASFVRIDMEGSSHTQLTLDAFKAVSAAQSNTGVVIQSYLHRSEADVEEMIGRGAHVRLCKGAYQEPSSIAYHRRPDIDANFVHLARHLLDAGRERPSVGGVPAVAIATHDDEMIEAARSFVESRAVPIDSFEFQMLYGVRRDVQKQLLDEGYHVRIYVPYGTEWYPYFMRRMAERPANLLFVTRAVLGR
ncbi:MAG: proline dehydrogenase family protein [Gemmatimonadota bacterium]|nr:proline dehydrogenase family protein [Gemmatimonadota bacterium]